MKITKIYQGKYAVKTKSDLFTVNSAFVYKTYEEAEKDLKERMERDKQIKCAFIEEIFLLENE